MILALSEGPEHPNTCIFFNKNILIFIFIDF